MPIEPVLIIDDRAALKVAKAGTPAGARDGPGAGPAAGRCQLPAFAGES
jgi:hypothetical protein